MHRIEAAIDRPDREFVTEFEGVPTSILSDVTGNADVAMDAGIDPVGDTGTFAGSALTVKAVPGDNLIVHAALSMAEPGDALVIDAEGYTETAAFGELMAVSARANGIAGAVIDGATRDREGIDEVGFPVFARGVHPRGAHKNQPGSINVPVSCGGVVVDPGDVVVGDGDGVAALDPGEAAEALDPARKKMANEGDLRERAEAGEHLYGRADLDAAFADLDVDLPDQ